METPSPTSLSAGQIILGLVTASIAGGVFVALINRIGNWWSGRSKAEIVQINAGTVKLATEGQAAGAQMLMQAMERIRELVEINSELQDELSETGRQRDNLERDLEIEREQHERLKIASQLREHFIQQLEAANKMGLSLKELPVNQNQPERKDKAS